MAEAMEKFTLDFNCRTILLDVVREIDRVDAREMSRDTSGTRAFSQFLGDVAERIPDQLQPCLSLLTKHLVRSEFHCFRT
jgi:condensin complex subunit 1